MNQIKLRLNCRKLFMLIAACLMLELFTPVLAMAELATPSIMPAATSSVATKSTATKSTVATNSSTTTKSSDATNSTTTDKSESDNNTSKKASTSEATKSTASDVASSSATTSGASTSDATTSEAATSEATTSEATTSEATTSETSSLLLTTTSTNYVSASNSGSSSSSSSGSSGYSLYSSYSGSSSYSYSTSDLPADVVNIIPDETIYAERLPDEAQATAKTTVKSSYSGKKIAHAETKASETAEQESEESEGSTVNILKDSAKHLADNESEAEIHEDTDTAEGSVSMQEKISKIIIIGATVLLCTGIAIATFLFVRSRQ